MLNPKTIKTITLLNNAVGDELSAIHQYMYFHFQAKHQGYEMLSVLFIRTAITEMRHVESLAERILKLEGNIVMKASKIVEPITTPKEMLELAIVMENESAADYTEYAFECSLNGDTISKQLFESLLHDEQRHGEQYENEMAEINKFGIDFLSAHSAEKRRKTMAPNMEEVK